MKLWVAETQGVGWILSKSTSFLPTTDASNFDLGYVLSQDELGTDKSIAYLTQVEFWKKHELRKTTT